MKWSMYKLIDFIIEHKALFLLSIDLSSDKKSLMVNDPTIKHLAKVRGVITDALFREKPFIGNINAHFASLFLEFREVLVSLNQNDTSALTAFLLKHKSVSLGFIRQLPYLENYLKELHQQNEDMVSQLINQQLTNNIVQLIFTEEELKFLSEKKAYDFANKKIIIEAKKFLAEFKNGLLVAEQIDLDNFLDNLRKQGLANSDDGLLPPSIVMKTLHEKIKATAAFKNDAKSFESLGVEFEPINDPCRENLKMALDFYYDQDEDEEDDTYHIGIKEILDPVSIMDSPVNYAKSVNEQILKRTLADLQFELLKRTKADSQLEIKEILEFVSMVAREFNTLSPLDFAKNLIEIVDYLWENESTIQKNIKDNTFVSNYIKTHPSTAKKVTNETMPTHRFREITRLPEKKEVMSPKDFIAKTIRPGF